MRAAVLCALATLASVQNAAAQSRWLRRGLLSPGEDAVHHLAQQALRPDTLPYQDATQAAQHQGLHFGTPGASPPLSYAQSSHSEHSLHDMLAHGHNAAQQHTADQYSPLHSPWLSSSPSHLDNDLQFLDSLIKAPSNPHSPLHLDHGPYGVYHTGSPSQHSTGSSAGHYLGYDHHLNEEYLHPILADHTHHEHAPSPRPLAGLDGAHDVPAQSQFNSQSQRQFSDTNHASEGAGAFHSEHRVNTAHEGSDDSALEDRRRRRLPPEAGSLRTRQRRLYEAMGAGAPAEEVARLKELVTEARKAEPVRKRHRPPLPPETYHTTRMDHLIRQRAKVAPQNAQLLEEAIAKKAKHAGLPETPRDETHWRIMRAGWNSADYSPPLLDAPPAWGRRPRFPAHYRRLKIDPSTGASLERPSMNRLLSEKKRLKDQGGDTSEVSRKIEALAHEMNVPVPTSRSSYYYRKSKGPALIRTEPLPDVDLEKLSPRTRVKASWPVAALFREKAKTTDPEEYQRIVTALEAKAKAKGLRRATPNMSGWYEHAKRVRDAQKQGRQLRPYQKTGLTKLFRERREARAQGLDTTALDDKIAARAQQVGVKVATSESVYRKEVQNERAFKGLPTTDLPPASDR